VVFHIFGASDLISNRFVVATGSSELRANDIANFLVVYRKHDHQAQTALIGTVEPVFIHPLMDYSVVTRPSHEIRISLGPVRHFGTATLRHGIDDAGHVRAEAD
jgi:hypothetical protein